MQRIITLQELRRHTESSDSLNETPSPEFSFPNAFVPQFPNTPLCFSLFRESTHSHLLALQFPSSFSLLLRNLAGTSHLASGPKLSSSRSGLGTSPLTAIPNKISLFSCYIWQCVSRMIESPPSNSNSGYRHRHITLLGSMPASGKSPRKFARLPREVVGAGQ
jgi:hypothetical protein